MRPAASVRSEPGSNSPIKNLNRLAPDADVSDSTYLSYFCRITKLTGRVSCETWPCTRISVVRRIQFSKSPRPVPQPNRQSWHRQDSLLGGCATRQERTPKQRPVSTQARSLTSENGDVNPAGNPLAFHPDPRSVRVLRAPRRAAVQPPRTHRVSRQTSLVNHYFGTALTAPQFQFVASCGTG